MSESDKRLRQAFPNNSGDLAAMWQKTESGVLSGARPDRQLTSRATKVTAVMVAAAVVAGIAFVGIRVANISSSGPDGGGIAVHPSETTDKPTVEPTTPTPSPSPSVDPTPVEPSPSPPTESPAEDLIALATSALQRAGGQLGPDGYVHKVMVDSDGWVMVSVVVPEGQSFQSTFRRLDNGELEFVESGSAFDEYMQGPAGFVSKALDAQSRGDQYD